MTISRSSESARTGLPDVLLIGDPRLKEVCKEVVLAESDADITVLQAVLEEFRRVNGFGRAIAAPQVGFMRRFIACNFGKRVQAATIQAPTGSGALGEKREHSVSGEFVMLNPVIEKKSEETFSLWDDCMSFPWFLVKLRRHTSVTISFFNREGERIVMEDIAQDLSELLQHEMDHLDGILSTDHSSDIVARSVYEADPEYYNGLVDYAIVPTV